MNSKLKIFLLIFFLVLVIYNSCRNVNHIDKFNVNVDSLRSLPNNFYAYRRGRIYIEDINVDNYRTWFDLDDYGNIQSIYKVEDLKNYDNNEDSTITKYKVDTIKSKALAQKFIGLSRKYNFGHIYVDKKNKISFSYNKDITEEYVKTFNDSLKNLYLNNKDFKLLKNGWFKTTRD